MWSQEACHSSDEMSAGLSLWRVIRFGQHGRIRRKCNKDSGFVDAKSGEALQMFLMMTFLSGKFSGTWLTTAQRVAIWATDRHRERRFTVSSSFSKGRMFRCNLLRPFSIYGCLPQVCLLPLFGWSAPLFSWMVCLDLCLKVF